MDIREIRLANLRALAARFDSKRAFADRAGLSEGYLYQLDSPSPSRALGHRTARRIEKNLGLASGWMDTPHEGASIEAVPAHEASRVPIVPIESLEGGDLPPPSEWASTDQKLGKRSFAFRLIDSSMSPEFSPGDLIVIDPDVRPRPGDFVIARVRAEGSVLALFRRYRDRPGGCELAPANTDFASHAGGPQEIEIVGVMIEHRRYRKR